MLSEAAFLSCSLQNDTELDAISRYVQNDVGTTDTKQVKFQKQEILSPV